MPSRTVFENPILRSYRELLSLPPSFSADDLKKAYHRLAFLYHPDRNPSPSAREDFEKVKKAHEVLRDGSEVHRLNLEYKHSRLFKVCVNGLTLNFGSFFGYRLFQFETKRIVRSLRLGKEKTNESDIDSLDGLVFEEDNSILDNSAFDAIELVYAGKFSSDDEAALINVRTGDGFTQLPWVMLNNEGLLHFLNGRYEKSKRSYLELNRRMQNNLIFMYRLALCHIVLAFQNPKRTFLGVIKPDRIELEHGIRLLRAAIKLGENRSIGKQNCLIIRKTLAEVLEKSGHKRASKKVWQQIYELDPTSVEAVLHVQGIQASRELARRKRPMALSNGRSEKLKLTGKKR